MKIFYLLLETVSVILWLMMLILPKGQWFPLLWVLWIGFMASNTLFVFLREKHPSQEPGKYALIKKVVCGIMILTLVVRLIFFA